MQQAGTNVVQKRATSKKKKNKWLLCMFLPHLPPHQASKPSTDIHDRLGKLPPRRHLNLECIFITQARHCVALQFGMTHAHEPDYSGVEVMKTASFAELDKVGGGHALLTLLMQRGSTGVARA